MGVVGKIIALGILTTLSVFAQTTQELHPKRYPDGTYGYANRSGSFVITPKYHKAFPFNGGFARVQMYGNWGLINTLGEWVLKPKYQYVGWSDDPFYHVNKSWLHLSNSKGIAGQMFHPPAREKIGVLENGKWHLKGLKGGFKSRSYDSLGHLSGGYAPVYFKGKGWTYINQEKGIVKGEVYYSDVRTLSCGLVAVRTENPGIMVLDPETSTFIGEGYLDVEDLFGSLWSARGDKGWGVLDKQGEVKAELKFRKVNYLPYIKKVRLTPKSLWFLLDNELNVLWERQIDTAYFLSSSELVVEDNFNGQYFTESKLIGEVGEGEKCFRIGDYWIKSRGNKKEIFVEFPNKFSKGVEFDSLRIFSDYILTRNAKGSWEIRKKDLGLIKELGPYTHRLTDQLYEVREKMGGRLFNLYSRKWSDSLYDKFLDAGFGYVYSIKNGKKGLIDKECRVLIEPTTNYFSMVDEEFVVFMEPFSLEIKNLETGETTRKNGESFYKNGDSTFVLVKAKGKQLLNQKLERVFEWQPKNISQEYSNGLVNLRSRSGWGTYDLGKKEYLFGPNPDFDSLGLGNSSLIPVWIHGNMGFLNPEGALVISTQYQKVRVPSEGIFPFMLRNSWGLMDKHESFILQPRYEKVDHLIGDLWKVQKNGAVGIFSSEKGMLLDVQLEDAWLDHGKTWLIIQKNQSLGLVNLEGQQKSSIVYSEIRILRNGWLLVRMDEQWDLLDGELNSISPFNLSFLTSDDKGTFLIQKREDPVYLDVKDQ